MTLKTTGHATKFSSMWHQTTLYCWITYKKSRGVHERVTKCHLLFIIIMFQPSYFNMRDSLSKFALKVGDSPTTSNLWYSTADFLGILANLLLHQLSLHLNLSIYHQMGEFCKLNLLQVPLRWQVRACITGVAMWATVKGILIPNRKGKAIFCSSLSNGLVPLLSLPPCLRLPLHIQPCTKSL